MSPSSRVYPISTGISSRSSASSWLQMLGDDETEMVSIFGRLVTKEPVALAAVEFDGKLILVQTLWSHGETEGLFYLHRDYKMWDPRICNKPSAVDVGSIQPGDRVLVMARCVRDEPTSVSIEFMVKT